ncbi:helix-turn-helix transcriptional regulator [Variovorax sp. GT1P44]|uniref:helix-turn-helix transcriptional regulator n=1 Tax=Variovorax sp. GT1P44 TaxID=3443742 RepID=UPI003F4735C9
MAPISVLADDRSPYLDEFGERLRTLRSRRGVTRKELALVSGISERYLANLELGRANPSLVILDQVAHGLDCAIAELVGDATTLTPEWLLLRDLLSGRSEAELHAARVAIAQMLGAGTDGAGNLNRIALIGLRGAGKSTLGRMLAEELGVPFIELSTEIEQVAGYSIREIHDLYGPNAYRRYERRALEQTLQIHSEFVLATPGGMVAEPSTFSLLMSHCRTVWLRAKPEDHMSRVAQQGDFRPMAGNEEAMEDLRRILTGREAFYAKAEVQVDTSAQPLEKTLQLLRDLVQVGR